MAASFSFLLERAPPYYFCPVGSRKHFHEDYCAIFDWGWCGSAETRISAFPFWRGGMTAPLYRALRHWILRPVCPRTTLEKGMRVLFAWVFCDFFFIDLYYCNSLLERWHGRPLKKGPLPFYCRPVSEKKHFQADKVFLTCWRFL